MSPTPARRTRRTPEEAKNLILENAQKRLIDHGIRGLTVKDIAEDSKLNHGTLLHHFGNAEGMRMALLRKMTRELVAAMADVMASGATPEDSVVELFNLLNRTGHIKLLAWRALEEQAPVAEVQDQDGLNLQDIIAQITSGLSDHDQLRARNMVFLAVSAAVGWGICGEGFQQVLGLTPTQQEDFPHWAGQQIAKIATD